MKTNLLFAAVMAVALSSSCSKNEVVENPIDPSNAIGFGTYVGTATKAAVEDSFENGDVFVIDAYYTAQKNIAGSGATLTPFMQNQKVTAAVSGNPAATTWSYSPIKYWPNNDNDKVSFFAVTNATSVSPIDDFNALASGSATPSFTVTNANTDIMVASVLNQKKTTEAVKFEFQHTMSQVNFSAKTTNTFDDTKDNTTINITSLKVEYGATTYTGGTFTFANNGTKVGSWVFDSTTTARTADEFKATGGVSNVGIGTDLVTVQAANSPITIGVPLMILPSNNASYDVTVVYEVTTEDDSDSTNANDSTIPNTCTFKIAPKSMNTVYTYNLEIGLEAVKVTGEISTNGWGNEAGTVEVIDSVVNPETVTTSAPSTTGNK